MITCKEDNIGSSKIIENNFGEYIDKVKDRDNVTYKRYLIDVEKSLIEFFDILTNLCYYIQQFRRRFNETNKY